MTRKLDPCPICGAKCRTMSLHYTPQWDKPIACIRHRRTYPDNRPKESGCPYEVPDLRAHLAICARLAEKPKRPKVLATGYWCRNLKAWGLCCGPLPGGCNADQQADADCRRVDIVAREGAGR